MGAVGLFGWRGPISASEWVNPPLQARRTQAADSTTVPTYTIDVTNDDIRAALEAWERAGAAGAPAHRIDQLWGDVERLSRTQAWQLIEAIQAHGGLGRAPAGPMAPSDC